jgi:hypothetical protein
LSFATGEFATAHQLHHPQRNYAICLECQHHHGIDHFLSLFKAKLKGLKWFRKFNQMLCARDSSAIVGNLDLDRALG